MLSWRQRRQEFIFPQGGDDGYSYAFAAVQQLEKYGTEAFALYRLHSLDLSTEPAVEELSVFSIGARVRF